MRFEVYFRCYRYLGRLLNSFNFISIINHLWNLGDRYLVTRTPDRMLRHWGRVQMDTTYMGMFWGKTLWLVVCVMCGVGSWALDPQQGCGVILDPGVEWARPVCDQLARESPYELNNIETDPTSYQHLWYTIHPPQYIYGVRILREDCRPPQPSEDPNAQLHLVAETLHCPP